MNKIVARPLLSFVAYADKIKLYDQHKKSCELEKTLIAYIKSGLNVAATAKTLFVHRNTLRYRFQLLSEVTGLDMTVPDNMFNVYLELTKPQLKIQAYVNLYGQMEDPQMVIYKSSDEAAKHVNRPNYLATIPVTMEGDYVRS